jgi:oligopeptide transport system substrate-binding protein
VVNEKLVVVPNTHYWDNAKTVLQKVTFIPINQESSATKRYLAGDIDITESFPKNMYQKLLKDIPGQVYTPPQLGPITTRLTRKRADGRCPRSSGAEHDYRSPHYGGKGIRYRREAGLAFHP